LAQLSESRGSPYSDAYEHRFLKSFMSDHRNILYFLIGILTAAVFVLGYNLYQAKTKPDGVQINVGPNGLKIESK